MGRNGLKCPAGLGWRGFYGEKYCIKLLSASLMASLMAHLAVVVKLA